MDSIVNVWQPPIGHSSPRGYKILTSPPMEAQGPEEHLLNYGHGREWMTIDPFQHFNVGAERTGFLIEPELIKIWTPNQSAFAVMNPGLPPTEDLQPRNYFTYVEQNPFLEHKPATFFIEGPTKNGVIYPKEDIYFNAEVHTPTRSVDVAVEMDNLNPRRFSCNFIARQPGVYVGEAQVRTQEKWEHINHSPFKINVTRDYSSSQPRILINSNIHPSPRSNHSAWGIDVDRICNKMYVTDRNKHIIRVYSTDGKELTPIGHRLRHGESFYRPTGVVVDKSYNRLLISDKDNHRIVLCTLDGLFISSFGRPGHKNGEFTYPWGLAVSPDGSNIVVTDSRNHRIQMFDKNGNFISKYTTFENQPFTYRSSFDYPRGICFDSSGNYVFVSDFNRRAVDVFNKDLTQKMDFIPRDFLARPQGLLMDAAENLLVCDSMKNNLCVFTPNGQLSQVINTNDDNTIESPKDVALMNDNLLALLDGDGTVRVY